MKYAFVLCIAVFCSINHGLAQEIFKPFIVESKDEAVCKLVLNHYDSIYRSSQTDTYGISDSKDVLVPKLTPQKVEGLSGEIRTAEVLFEGDPMILVHYTYMRGIDDYSYEFFVLPKEFAQLIQLLKSGNLSNEHFKAFYSELAWRPNLPFKYGNKWYVLDDPGNFYQRDSIRTVSRVLPDWTVKQVCSIKIFEMFDSDKDGNKFPFFTAYRKATEEIMRSDATLVCGSAGVITAQQNGRLYGSMLIKRPWAVRSSWNPDGPTAAFQKKHFEHWKYQDIWSYRESETFENAKSDAIAELTDHLVKNYSYSKEAAEGIATGAINAMPGKYYSLGYYYSEHEDFSGFQKMIEGTYEDWGNIKQELEIEYEGSLSITRLTLLADNPQLLLNLPPTIKKEDIKSFYGKDILMYAVHMNNYDAVKYLIDSGWPVNNVTPHHRYMCVASGPSIYNRSALTYAAENASIELIKLLVEAGAPTDILDSKGNNLDFYINKNPRFSVEEKALGFDGLLKKYSQPRPIKPSFSCSSKLNVVEQSICSSEGLSIYDRELSEVYKQATSIEKISKQIKTSQVKWIKRRNNDCSIYQKKYQIAACVARSTRARIRYLEYVLSSFNSPRTNYIKLE